MKIASLDHFVLTTNDLAACVKFYKDVMGMEVRQTGNRYALYFGKSKINIHTKPAEFLPAADNPQVGSLDICFVVDESIEKVYQELMAYGDKIEYPWKDMDAAVIRSHFTKKWYALFMKIHPGKIGLGGRQPIRIMDLHGRASGNNG